MDSVFGHYLHIKERETQRTGRREDPEVKRMLGFVDLETGQGSV